MLTLLTQVSEEIVYACDGWDLTQARQDGLNRGCPKESGPGFLTYQVDEAFTSSCWRKCFLPGGTENPGWLWPTRTGFGHPWSKSSV